MKKKYIKICALAMLFCVRLQGGSPNDDASYTTQAQKIITTAFKACDAIVFSIQSPTSYEATLDGINKTFMLLERSTNGHSLQPIKDAVVRAVRALGTKTVVTTEGTKSNQILAGIINSAKTVLLIPVTVAVMVSFTGAGIAGGAARGGVAGLGSGIYKSSSILTHDAFPINHLGGPYDPDSAVMQAAKRFSNIVIKAVGPLVAVATIASYKTIENAFWGGVGGMSKAVQLTLTKSTDLQKTMLDIQNNTQKNKLYQDFIKEGYSPNQAIKFIQINDLVLEGSGKKILIEMYEKAKNSELQSNASYDSLQDPRIKNNVDYSFQTLHNLALSQTQIENIIKRLDAYNEPFIKANIEKDATAMIAADTAVKSEEARIKAEKLKSYPEKYPELFNYLNNINLEGIVFSDDEKIKIVDNLIPLLSPGALDRNTETELKLRKAIINSLDSKFSFFNQKKGQRDWNYNDPRITGIVQEITKDGKFVLVGQSKPTTKQTILQVMPQEAEIKIDTQSSVPNNQHNEEDLEFVDALSINPEDNLIYHDALDAPIQASREQNHGILSSSSSSIAEQVPYDAGRIATEKQAVEDAIAARMIQQKEEAGAVTRAAQKKAAVETFKIY